MGSDDWYDRFDPDEFVRWLRRLLAETRDNAAYGGRDRAGANLYGYEEALEDVIEEVRVRCQD